MSSIKKYFLKCYSILNNYTTVQQAMFLIAIPCVFAFIAVAIFSQINDETFRRIKYFKTINSHYEDPSNTTARMIDSKSDWRENVRHSLTKEIFPDDVMDITIDGSTINVHLYNFELKDYNTAITCVREFQGVYYANTGKEVVTGEIYHINSHMKTVVYTNSGLQP